MQARENDFNQIRNEEFANKVQAKDDRVTLRLDLNWSVGGFIREKGRRFYPHDSKEISTRAASCFIALNEYITARDPTSSAFEEHRNDGIKLRIFSKDPIISSLDNSLRVIITVGNCKS
ncbi:uncharacterized protein [Prorops nasuta]|uniref:uncharacterized protein isoform X1 n=1 Tax=Prorops nasuta TaxID=863751 RepID=UPI0034CF0CE0